MDPLNRKVLAAEQLRPEWLIARDAWASPDVRLALEALGGSDGRRVLELGCGLGCGMPYLSHGTSLAVGTDFSPARCAAAAQMADGKSVVFAAADATDLPFSDASFDSVFALDLLMYASPRRVAAECCRVLKPGGRAAFVESLTGAFPLGLYRRLTWPTAYRRFTRHLSLQELSSLGPPLRLVRVEAFFLLSTLAFFFLFAGRSHGLYGRLMRMLNPIDRALLSTFPWLRRAAYRGVAIYARDHED